MLDVGGGGGGGVSGDGNNVMVPPQVAVSSSESVTVTVKLMRVIADTAGAAEVAVMMPVDAMLHQDGRPEAENV